MNKYQLLQSFMEELDQYNDQDKDINLEIFCKNYLSKTNNNSLPDHIFYEFHNRQLPGATILSIYIRKISKFLLAYSKKLLQNTPLHNVEDYAYLKVIEQMPNITKTNLILEMNSEFTSGIEIIKRLINMDFIEEFQDEHDKRSKNLRITENGRMILLENDPNMAKVGQLVFGHLSVSEIQAIYDLLHPIIETQTPIMKRLKDCEFVVQPN